MSRDWGRPGIEPTLEEALTDPIVLLVMRRGRVTADEVRAVVEEARRRYRHGYGCLATRRPRSPVNEADGITFRSQLPKE